LLVALAMRAAIPTGWMPTFTPHGVSLIPCFGWVVQGEPQPGTHAKHADHAVHESSGAKHDGSDKPKHDMPTQPCSFAAAAVDLPWPVGSDSLAMALPSAPDFARLRFVSVGRGLVAPPPPSTGPPLAA
jgi:hypothetical protein